MGTMRQFPYSFSFYKRFHTQGKMIDIDNGFLMRCGINGLKKEGFINRQNMFKMINDNGHAKLRRINDQTAWYKSKQNVEPDPIRLDFWKISAIGNNIFMVRDFSFSDLFRRDFRVLLNVLPPFYEKLVSNLFYFFFVCEVLFLIDAILPNHGSILGEEKDDLTSEASITSDFEKAYGTVQV